MRDRPTCELLVVMVCIWVSEPATITLHLSN